MTFHSRCKRSTLICLALPVLVSLICFDCRTRTGHCRCELASLPPWELSRRAVCSVVHLPS